MPEYKPIDEKLRPFDMHHAGPLGACMYCGDSKSTLSDEHIVPYWMSGNWVLKKSSCLACAKITRGFEENLAYTAFMGLRTRLNMQSRSKRREPPRFEVVVEQSDGSSKTESVSAEELPPLFANWVFSEPGILAGRNPLQNIDEFKLSVQNLSGRLNSDKTVYGKIRIPSEPVNQMRLAAKIAHGFMNFHSKFSRYERLLEDVILTGHFAPYFVGSFDETEIGPPEKRDGLGILHRIETKEFTIEDDNVHIYLVFYLHILAPFGGPCFKVVAGRRVNPISSLLAYPRTIPIPKSDGNERVRDEVFIHLEILPA